MHTKFTRLYIILYLLLATPLLSLGQKGGINYGLSFVSYEKPKEYRTSLNITPEEPLHLTKDFTIKFDLSYQRFNNAYGYILRTIANDSINIDLVSSPDNQEFGDMNLVMRNTERALRYEFKEVGLEPSEWTTVKISFEKTSNRVTFEIGNMKKTEHFIVKGLDNFKLLFGANHFGSYSTSDVPPIAVKNIEIISDGRIVRSWALKKYLENKVYDETGNYAAEVENPVWLLDKHAQWLHRQKFITGVYPAITFNEDKGELYCIDQQYLYTYQFNGDKTIEKTLFSEGNPIYTPANQLVYDKKRGQLINYDLFRNMYLRYDFAENKWNNKEDTVFLAPNYGHHNKFYSSKNDELYTFGGYGHYVYKNTFYKYDKDSSKWSKVHFKGTIPPRYLGASGFESENRVLIYGGYGSLTGKQELSPQSFYDLYSIDLNKKEVTKVRDYKISAKAEDLAFSNSLVVNKDENCFYVLNYDKNKYSSFANLGRYSLSSPEFKIVGDSIPFNFHDENSFCDLFLSKATKELIAVTAFKDKEQYQVNIYSIEYPPLAFAETQQEVLASSQTSYWYYIIGFIVACIGVFVIIRKSNQNSKQQPSIPEQQPISKGAEEPNKLESFQPYLKREEVRSAIYFLGGFQVFNKTGTDITGKFSTTLKELFVLILMHSVKYEKGIPTALIHEFLWSDKDEVSARNNRNVNLKKLRSLLEDIGDITIDNNNSYIKIFIGKEIFFDYQFVFSILDQVNKNHSGDRELFRFVLSNVKRGSLLANMDNSWLDNFKTEFSNDIADLLLEYSKKLSLKKDAKMLLEIADAIFNYDTVNEDALIIKCSVLNSTGKYSLAKLSYEHVVKEYKNMYMEDYPKSFHEVISNGEKLAG